MGRVLILAKEAFLFQSSNPLDLAETLCADGHDVVVAAPFAPEAEQVNRARGFALRVLSERSGNPGFWWQALRAARAELPDVVVGVNVVGFLAADLSRMAGFARKLVYYALEFSTPAEHSRSLSVGWQARRARSADLVLTTGADRSRAMRESFGLREEPTVVANAALRAPRGRGRLRTLAREAGCCAKELVVYVGAISAVVRVATAAEASRLWQRDAALVLIGFGGSEAERAELDAAVAASQGRSVRLPAFAGGREALLELIADADAGLVLYDHRRSQDPNVMLATPNKTYDYLACGLPVIASDTPTLVQLVEGEGFGVCCDPSDPALIARAVDRLLEKKQSFAARAREVFTRELNYGAQSAIARSRIAELAGGRSG